MLTQRARQLAYQEAAIDAIALVVAFLLAFFARSGLPLPAGWPALEVEFASHFWLICLGLPLYGFLAFRGRVYERTNETAFAPLAFAIFRQFVYLALILGATIFLFKAKSVSRLVFVFFMIFGYLLVIAGRAFSPRTIVDTSNSRNVLMVGTGPDALDIRRKIERNPNYDMRLVGHLSDGGGAAGVDPDEVLGGIDDLKRIVEERVVDDVIFAIPIERLVACEEHLAWCEEVGVNAHLKVDFVRTLMARTYPMDLDGTPMLTICATPNDAGAMLAKRLLDVTVAAVTLFLLLPVLLAVAVVVRLTSRGPVLFRQQRVGLNGRLFTLLKFRSMQEDAEPRRKELETLNEMSGPVFKIRNDPRVTPVGRVLRKFSLDELPQLWNVLRGDMSLVGPRPPLADEVRKYERWQRRRLSMKPGVTCLWQIKGRNRIGFEEWMKLDLAYIDNWSLGLDLMILLRTVPVVLRAKGAH